MMLGTVTREMEISTYNVKALDGKVEMKVNVTKVDKHELLNVDNPKYEELIASYEHLKGVYVEDNDKKSKMHDASARAHSEAPSLNDCLNRDHRYRIDYGTCWSE